MLIKYFSNKLVKFIKLKIIKIRKKLIYSKRFNIKVIIKFFIFKILYIINSSYLY